jgi:hypothetical protein
MNMETKEKTELEKYQDEMSRKRKVRQQALAILSRAKEAGIPESQMRITENEFKQLIDTDYCKYRKWDAKGIDTFCHGLFTIPSILLKTPFILIDGGNMYSRKRAAYALLFRMIAWDRLAMCYSCANVAHSLQQFKSNGDISRNDFAMEIKQQDMLYISECEVGLFKPIFEAGSFLDEILEWREARNKPTILSFVNPIPLKGYESRERVSDLSTGQYMMMFSEADSGDYTNKNIIRIRVK